jgi:phosphoglycolate phosphatase
LTSAFIFDMDNTLLQSKIDFPKMKKTVYELLVRENMLPPEIAWQSKTTSELIALSRKHQEFSRVEKEVWLLIEEIETEGMKDAVLEPYAAQVLEDLSAQSVAMTILTNNARHAAIAALQRLSIDHLFSLIAGREQMEELKPSASGVHYILRHYPAIPQQDWLMIGDSWIDGMAAKRAGIRFLAYQANLSEMIDKGLEPQANLQTLRGIKDWIT